MPHRKHSEGSGFKGAAQRVGRLAAGAARWILYPEEDLPSSRRRPEWVMRTERRTGAALIALGASASVLGFVRRSALSPDLWYFEGVALGILAVGVAGINGYLPQAMRFVPWRFRLPPAEDMPTLAPVVPLLALGMACFILAASLALSDVQHLEMMLYMAACGASFFLSLTVPLVLAIARLFRHGK